MSNLGQHLCAEYLIENKGNWVSSWQVASYLKSKDFETGSIRGVTADTASRFLSKLCKQGFAEKKRGKGVNGPWTVDIGPCTLWRTV